MVTSDADQYTLMIISRSDRLRMTNVSYKTRTEDQNTRLVFRNIVSKIAPFMRKYGKI